MDHTCRHQLHLSSSYVCLEIDHESCHFLHLAIGENFSDVWDFSYKRFV